MRSKKIKKKKLKSNSSYSRNLDNTKVESNSINHSKYDQVEETSYKKFIKIPAPTAFEETSKSIGQRLEEESNIYSPLAISGRNQVEHFNSRDSNDEFEKYRKALNTSNSKSKNRRKLYLELIAKFEDEERSYKKSRSKSKS
jgi:hypothetical protein